MSDDPATPDPAAHDWNHHGRHRLRAPDGVVVDLPVPVEPLSRIWVATIWPDRRQPGDWNRALWEPAGRGWRLPLQLAAGDVIEFGADTPHRLVRWFGIMDSYEPDRWATLQGPYSSPADAWNEAQRLLGLERFLPALDPAPTTPAPCHGRRRRRHH